MNKIGLGLLLFGLIGVSGCGSDGSDAEPGAIGSPGLDGAISLVDIAEEPPGDNCPYGGQAISSGVDLDGDGQLADDEVTATAYICESEPAAAGQDGDSVLIMTSEDSLEEECPAGGTRIEAGADTNGDGVLQPDEISSTSFVCHGRDGATALIRVDEISPGSTCWAGGVAVHSGFDEDGDNLLSDEEIVSTVSICSPVNLPLSLDSAEAYGCTPWFYNGNMLVSGAEGATYIYDFPGNHSQPGTLHRLDRAGVFTDSVNIAVPPGTNSLKRAPSGAIYASGTGIYSGTEMRHHITELDPLDGSTMATVFEQTGSFYMGGLGIDEQGLFYFGNVSQGSIYHVDGDTLVEYAPGVGNNTRLLFSNVDGRLYIGTGNWFGYTAPGETVTRITDHQSPCWISGLDQDEQGHIYVGHTCDPYDSMIENEKSHIVRYNADGTGAVLLLEFEGGLRGPIYDAENSELIFAVSGSGTDRVSGCEAANAIYYRLSL